ncbi:uncharacterized protein RJT20DRAFT_123814 [Scheffersomyces xylosifermentans]|uniref:uncharacterized protein n=1 Tax=Scheffersomyces xylosifermentans TaxID=1304137 RepID=UPI00315D7CE5
MDISNGSGQILPRHKKVHGENNENDTTSTKGKRSLTHTNVARRRIPLGSKDQNQQVPGLARAKTTLNTPTLTNTNSSSQNLENFNAFNGKQSINSTINNSNIKNTNKITNSVSQRRILLPQKAPALSKANSSLGFIHHNKNINSFNNETPTNNNSNTPTNLKNSTPSWQKLSEWNTKSSETFQKRKVPKLSPLDSNILGAERASRSADLSETTNLTDSFQKRAAPPRVDSAPVPDLSSTFSAATATLHASNIVSRDINANNVDPIKKAPKQTPLRGLSLDKNYIKAFGPEEDAFPDLPIEFGPPKITPLESYPEGLEPLGEDDLEFFSKPNRTILTKENYYEHPDIKHAESIMQINESDLNPELSFGFEDDGEDQDDGSGMDMELSNVGLSIDEMKDLLN